MEIRLVAFELVNVLGNCGVEKLTEIANYVYNSEDVLEMLESIFTALPKRSGTIECQHHQTLSLLSHVTKIILISELNRVKGTITETYQINILAIDWERGLEMRLCLRTLVEKYIERQRDLYICFMDYLKTLSMKT